jgi:hypothetical protein
VDFAAVTKHADFVIANEYDPAVAFAEVRGFADQCLCHRAIPPRTLAPGADKSGPAATLH